MPQNPEQGRRVTPEMREAMERHGGLMPMHLTDADSGQTLYDNRDATAMAILNAKRGGKAASAMTGGKHDCIATLRCYLCNDSTSRSFTQIFGTGWNCGGCGAFHTPLDPPPVDNFSLTKWDGSFKNSPLEDYVENWIWRKYVIPRYINYIKSVPTRILNKLNIVYNKVMKKYHNLQRIWEIIRYQWKRTD